MATVTLTFHRPGPRYSFWALLLGAILLLRLTVLGQLNVAEACNQLWEVTDRAGISLICHHRQHHQLWCQPASNGEPGTSSPCSEPHALQLRMHPTIFHSTSPTHTNTHAHSHRHTDTHTYTYSHSDRHRPQTDRHRHAETRTRACARTHIHTHTHTRTHTHTFTQACIHTNYNNTKCSGGFLGPLTCNQEPF